MVQVGRKKPKTASEKENKRTKDRIIEMQKNGSVNDVSEWNKIQVGITEFAAMIGFSTVVVSRWASEDTETPFKNATSDVRSRKEASLVDAIRWALKRQKKEEKEVDLNKLNQEEIKSHLYRVASTSSGNAAVSALKELNNILKDEGHGLPEIVTVRMAIIEPDDDGNIIETDKVIESKHRKKK